MMRLGGRIILGDEFLVFFHEDEKLIGMITLNVENFQGAGTERFFKNVFGALTRIFKISKREIPKIQVHWG